MSDTNIAKLTASKIPDVVRDAFSDLPALTMRDVLLLESVGVNFIATGENPSLFEMSVLNWLVLDRPAFEQAAATNEFRAALYAWAAGIQPSVIRTSAPHLAALIKRSFAPLEGGAKKPGETETP